MSAETENGITEQELEQGYAITVGKAFAGALLAVQKELPKLQKDAINPHFKNRYISLDSLMAAIRPVLSKHGLVWITTPCRDEQGEPALSYRLVHADSGEFEGGTMPLLLTKQDPQGLGSAITYARRYSITAMLGLVADEDDDANAGSEPQANGKAKAKASGPRLLNQTERDRVLGAIADTDQNEAMLFAAVGVSSIEEVTTEHAKQIRALIDKAVSS